MSVQISDNFPPQESRSTWELCSFLLSTFLLFKNVEIIAQKHLFRYDLMLHWYMTNPEYRKDEPEESKRLDNEIIEDDEESEDEAAHENTGAFARIQRSFRRASSRTRANSTVLTPIQTPGATPSPILPSPVASTNAPTPTPTTHANSTANNLQANGRRTPSKSPRQTVYLND
jgi:hypothetical protein